MKNYFPEHFVYLKVRIPAQRNLLQMLGTLCDTIKGQELLEPEEPQRVTQPQPVTLRTSQGGRVRTEFQRGSQRRLDASPMLQPVKTRVGEGPTRLLALTQVAPGRPCYPPTPQSRLLAQYCMLSRLDLPPAPSGCRSPKPLSPAPLSSQSGSSCTYEPASPSACTSNPKKTPMSIYQEECDKPIQPRCLTG